MNFRKTLAHHLQFRAWAVLMVATPLLACGGGGADQESSAANVLVDAGLNFPVGRGAECSDGLDNDGDGLIDAPADPGCESALDSSELDEVKPQCADDIDNDGDGLIDYGPDPGCDDFQDNDETDPIVLQCNDGIDNDGDGLIDTQDPGCPVQQDNDESDDPSLPACSDGVDNDGDGDIDHPQDRGCSAPEDTDESGDMPLNAQPQCADGVDNDGDGLVDVADPGCRSASAPREDDPGITPQCANGIDDDDNLLIDFPYDPGCHAAGDDEEISGDTEPACSNRIDDDNDGLTDFPADPGCAGAGDRDELDLNSPPACADGVDNDGDALTDWPADLGCTSRGDPVEEALCGAQRAATELENGVPVFGNTMSGSYEYDGTCGGRGGAESIYFYRLDRRVERLEISTQFEETSVDTVLYVRRRCASKTTEVACRAEVVGDEGRGQILNIDNPSRGDYFIFVDTVTATPGEFKVSVAEIPIAECQNEEDDDMDGRIDYPRDPGCETPADPSEVDPDEAPICSDDIDNDGDNLIDYPLDLGCRAASDSDEVDLCGQGVRFTAFPINQSRLRGTTASPTGDECDEMTACPNGDGPIPSRCLGGLCYQGCTLDTDCPENSGQRCLNGVCISNNRFEGSCGGADLNEQVFSFENTVNANLTFTVVPLVEEAAMAEEPIVPPPERNLAIYVRRDCDNLVDGVPENTELGCSTDKIGQMNNGNPEGPQPIPRDGDEAPNDGNVEGVENMLPADSVRLTVNEVSPGTVFIFVDTKLGVGGPFELRVEIERLPPLCSDQRDNDGDGYYDADDPGCTGPDDESEADPIEQPSRCADGLDNDMDGLIDYPNDPGCAFRGGLSEEDPAEKPACSDGIDNDEDDWTDFPEEPGCASAGDNDEDDTERPQCRNSLDDDMDGLVDYPDDPGCAGRGDVSEKDDREKPPCTDRLDNDQDGLVDYPFDPGCRAAGDLSEIDPVVAPVCANGFDDDGDMKIDFPFDPGCESARDGDEADGNFPPQCADGQDNNQNGRIDWPDDPGCRFAGDTREQFNGRAITRCADGVDNDMDGLVDLSDGGCVDARDDDESDPVDGHRCNDGVDNDEDGEIDWPADVGCAARGAACEQAGHDLCGGVCEDLVNDEMNCGECGRQCEDGIECIDGFCDGLFVFEGVRLNTSENDLRGWSVCHRDRYNQTNTQVADLLANCAGEYVMLGCKPVNQANVSVLAMGERDEVFRDTGAGVNSVNRHNGVDFYFNPSRNMGFAAAGSGVNRTAIGDTSRNEPQFRLSWRTSVNRLSSGYRCGGTIDLTFRNGPNWERIIWTSR